MVNTRSVRFFQFAEPEPSWTMPPALSIYAIYALAEQAGEGSGALAEIVALDWAAQIVFSQIDYR